MAGRAAGGNLKTSSPPGTFRQPFDDAAEGKPRGLMPNFEARNSPPRAASTILFE
jgi:hypothetical protein